MRLGYPCINRSVGCTANSTFRIASYSEGRLLSAVGGNLSCLERTLDFNTEHGLLFFRIGSGFVPFASHPICRTDWAGHFRKEFRRIGSFIKRNRMRISMHPDQFTLINTPRREVLERSIAELEYHARVLDAMGLGTDAKIQIHVGGLYGNREGAIWRFVSNYGKLPQAVQRRLVVENDDRLFPFADCLRIHDETGIPVLFDSFHHACLNRGEPLREALLSASETWGKRADGPLMCDYSSQQKGARKGGHASHLDPTDFRCFLRAARGLDMDVMLEIKDKERSAMLALACLGRATMLKRR